MYISNFLNKDDFVKLSSCLRELKCIVNSLDDCLIKYSTVKDNVIFISCNSDLLESLQNRKNIIESFFSQYCEELKFKHCENCPVGDSSIPLSTYCRECLAKMSSLIED